MRDYGVAGQIGLEKTPEEYIAKMVEVFQEVKRVLREDGTLWLNMGDSYTHDQPGRNRNGTGGQIVRPYGETERVQKGNGEMHSGLKPKDLCGIPWRVALALQANGWWLRSDIIWYKRNPMPESVTDRPTKAHEYIFLLTKSAKYYYDAEAVKEDGCTKNMPGPNMTDTRETYGPQNGGNSGLAAARKRYIANGLPATRNLRSVWDITTKGYPGAHFATFPPELPERCIKAGTSEKGCCSKCGMPWERVVEKDRKNRTELDPGDPRYRPNQYNGAYGDINGKADAGYTEVKTLGWSPGCECNADVVPCTVLDPFAGSFTTCMVARNLGRQAIGIELNEKYIELGKQRNHESILL